MRSPAVLFTAILSAVFLVLLFVGGPWSFSVRWGQAVWNLGHIPCFALWTWLLLSLRPGLAARPFWRQSIEVLGLAFLAGVIIELLQLATGRSMKANDVALDLLGSLLVLAFFSPTRRTAPRRLLRSVQTIAVALLVLALVPLALDIADEIRAHRQFPLLSGFETRYEIDRWKGDTLYYLDRSVAPDGGCSLEVLLTTEEYSGVSLRHFPGDWRSYRILRFSVRNGRDGPLRLCCRIHDEEHFRRGGTYEDRFTTGFILDPGWNEIVIPLDDVARAPSGRTMAMDRIEALMIFSVSLPEPVLIHIDDVRLAEERTSDEISPKK